MSTKSLFPILSSLLLIGLAIVLLPPTQPLVPGVRGTNRTISLVGSQIGAYYYWNSSNPTITVNQGDIVTINLSSGGGVPHRFLLDVDGDGVSDTSDCSPTMDPCSVTFTTSTSITFTASSTAMYYCTIHYPYMVGSFMVQAPPAPDFSVASSPSSLAFVQGSSRTSSITVTSQNGFSGTVNLAATVSPLGPTPSVNPNSVTISSGTSGTSTLTVSTTSSTPSGSYTVTVTGTSGSTSHTTTVTVLVSAPASQDFTISSSPPSLNVTQGSSTSSTITLTSLNGFSGVLSLTGTVSPSGPSVSFSPTSISLSAGGYGTSTMTVSAVAGYYSSVATGNYLVNVTATNGSLPHSKTVPVAVTSPTSTTPSPSGSLPAAILIGAGAALVAAVAVVVYLVRRKPVAG